MPCAITLRKRSGTVGTPRTRQRRDALSGFLNLGRVSHVQFHARPSPTRVDRSLAATCVVLVVSAQPHLAVFVATLGRPVEDRVVAHQELGSAGVAGVAVVDVAPVAGERTDTVALGEVAGDVRAGRVGVLGGDRRGGGADLLVPSG